MHAYRIHLKNANEQQQKKNEKCNKAKYYKTKKNGKLRKIAPFIKITEATAQLPCLGINVS